VETLTTYTPYAIHAREAPPLGRLSLLLLLVEISHLHSFNEVNWSMSVVVQKKSTQKKHVKVLVWSKIKDKIKDLRQ
jgi:hypothetical protein